MYTLIRRDEPHMGYQFLKINPYEDYKQILLFKISQNTHLITQPAITCSKLTIETLEQSAKYVQWCRSDVFIVNFEHISHLVLVFLLLTLSRKMPAGKGLTRKRDSEKRKLKQYFTLKRNREDCVRDYVLTWMTKHWKKVIFPFHLIHLILIFHLQLKVCYFRKSPKKVPQF